MSGFELELAQLWSTQSRYVNTVFLATGDITNYQS